MRSYWHTHYSDLALINALSPLKQVGKTVNGIEVGEDQVALIVGNIAKSLELTPTDTLFDLCCGNGVLTLRLAEFVGSVIGIDFTERLLQIAHERYSRYNLRYQLADVVSLSACQMASANRILMYEALQYFTPAQFSRLMHTLGQLPSGTRFFVGGIPDRRRLHDFYNTEDKLRFYQECEQAGRSHLGQWWLEEDVRKLAGQAGYTMISLEQPDRLYTAYYRFDALLEKKR